MDELHRRERGLVDDRKRDALREHYDTTDLTDAIDSATWDTEVEADPMVVTSVRMPRSLLEWVREQAEIDQVKPTALIRRWIEDRRRGSRVPETRDESAVARLADRVARLEALALRTAAPDPDVDRDGIAELLAALQASVAAARAGSGSGHSDQERRGA
jgi:hypothetical protein